MKIITTRTILTALVALATYTLFAQDKDAGADNQKFRLHVVKEENGVAQVIDKTFATKDEMDAYIKTNKIDEPVTNETSGGALPTVHARPTPPPPPSPRPPVADPGNPANKEKKIIIIEKEEGGIKGKSDFSIDLSQLSQDEVTKVIQEVLNMNVAKTEIVHIKKDIKNVQEQELYIIDDEKGTDRTRTDDLQADNTANVTNLKVYPNPGRQFHLECNVNKPCNVKLRVLDMQGKEVYEEAINADAGKLEKDINGAELNKGTYVMDIEAGGQRTTTTVVLQ